MHRKRFSKITQIGEFQLKKNKKQKHSIQRRWPFWQFCQGVVRSIAIAIMTTLGCQVLLLA